MDRDWNMICMGSDDSSKQQLVCDSACCEVRNEWRLCCVVAEMSWPGGSECKKLLGEKEIGFSSSWWKAGGGEMLDIL